VAAEYSQEYGPGCDPAGRPVDRYPPRYGTPRRSRLSGLQGGALDECPHAGRRHPGRTDRGPQRGWTPSAWTRRTSSARCRPQSVLPPTRSSIIPGAKYMAGGGPEGAPWKLYRLPRSPQPRGSLDVAGGPTSRATRCSGPSTPTPTVRGTRNACRQLGPRWALEIRPDHLLLQPARAALGTHLPEVRDHPPTALGADRQCLPLDLCRTCTCPLADVDLGGFF